MCAHDHQFIVALLWPHQSCSCICLLRIQGPCRPLYLQSKPGRCLAMMAIVRILLAAVYKIEQQLHTAHHMKATKPAGIPACHSLQGIYVHIQHSMKNCGCTDACYVYFIMPSQHYHTSQQTGASMSVARLGMPTFPSHSLWAAKFTAIQFTDMAVHMCMLQRMFKPF